MISIKKLNLQSVKGYIIFFTPLILGVCTTAFQFMNVESLTSGELILVNATQFVSSLWFGWVVSSIFSEEEFQAKQKKFAFSAYRRIREIETNLDRLLNRLTQKMKGQQSLQRAELDSIKEIALSLQTAIKSSNADWLDIIGEEIEKIKNIEQTKKFEIIPGKEAQEKEEYLLGTLSPSLEIQAREILNSDENLETNVSELTSELENLGYIEFDGFWDKSFEKDIFTLPVGTEIFINVDDVGSRSGVLVAHTMNGESLGVITNKLVGTSSYLEFMNAVIRAFGKSKFSAEYSKKGDLFKSKRKDLDERHYFKAKIMKGSI